MKQLTSWEKRTYLGMVILTVGILIVDIGRPGYGVIGLGFGYLISAFWKKTHPDVTKIVAERKNQKNRALWRNNLKRKITSGKTNHEEIAISLSDETEIE